ncbi:putative protein kinase RLK-Pelle-CrRLK1L-1 family [Helianthus annuus]|uniref:non-specific serine/threonine protein kinase n=1 Tax=Helianthus annuus TaxID=4232 RepID=A0A9K3EJI9_HELAN|nr:receptor-like protein kinase HERK 1 [Helianthus annuus]KAF5774468.1 putative protein kinase RLK-Pelle-CrRLK1L-1 family [Helianthus annuus]KAJ0477822.1 putative protein kinase RLK-Pelle-CrRLK1L-1 family [Helianthus annuus]KAJ0482409.1 putative protein kinase RLK-Pelle-CrRLK1L-1 family [Helianthus annuus]KAJ0498654.1 putative protein kinase RLK-Pelle-CrRLK1L-1 family [Helianthus annuus]KAJ0664667.1 putative protein kinase RLK-Pelle-CrRLK1L-1 family [Helianthus annuus]
MSSLTIKEEKTPSLLPALEQPCRCFSMSELSSATDNFDEKWCIGHGGFGKVYKGKFSDGPTNTYYAIKRLHFQSQQGATEFWVEVELLSRLRHCNIVPLIGYCNEGKEMALVYEYMQNGTLYDHLHKNGTVLTWSQRLKICLGAARGLDYLHTGTGTQQGVIHRDVKSSNILLDRNFAAKIADFGLAKIGPINQTCTYVSTTVKGSFGYMDPNYFYTGRLTRKSDVYAFGVVLLEVLSGRPALDASLDEGLAIWAQELIRRGRVTQIISSSLRDHISKSSLKEFSGIAVRCLISHPNQRPTMTEVVGSLDRALSFQERKASLTKGWITINNVWSLLTLRSSGAAESKEISDNTVINENIRVKVPAIVTEVVDQREALKGQDQNQSRSSNSRSGGGGSRVELPHVFMLAAVPTQEGENEVSDTSNPEYDGDDNVADKGDAEWVEQYAPGVYVTLKVLRDGTKYIQRVRFSRKMFSERQAEQWWLENREKICEEYMLSRLAESLRPPT